jgi:hypothetical protein
MLHLRRLHAVERRLDLLRGPNDSTLYERVNARIRFQREDRDLLGASADHAWDSERHSRKRNAAHVRRFLQELCDDIERRVALDQVARRYGRVATRHRFRQAELTQPLVVIEFAQVDFIAGGARRGHPTFATTAAAVPVRDQQRPR